MHRLVAIFGIAIVSMGDAAPAQSRIEFEATQLSPGYFSEGATLGDLNGDGWSDLISGHFWSEGPDFQKHHAVHPPIPASIDSFALHFLTFAQDLDGDQDQDILAISLPGTLAVWFENPGIAAIDTPWPIHPVSDQVGGESPILTDFVGDSAPELLCTQDDQLGYLTPNPIDPRAPWTFVPLTAPTFWGRFLHGMGVGDLNGDGRQDILTGFGWLEQPPTSSDPWPFHAAAFDVIGGAQMHAYDVDGDGDQDVVSSINAHGYGLSWFEQLPDGSFLEHPILSRDGAVSDPVQFSQLHALELVDLDGDGLRDIVTGKTWRAHNGIDPGADDPALLYWFRLQRNPVGFIPELIHSDSGVGRQIAVGDLDGDARPDIVTGNKKGLHLFRQRRLMADPQSIAQTTGGVQTLHLNAGAAWAGASYQIFTTRSGTEPGLDLAGRHVPFNPDAFTTLSISLANTPALPGFLGILDGTGRAEARLVVPPGLPLSGDPPFQHVFLALRPDGTLLPSNPVPLRIQ